MPGKLFALVEEVLLALSIYSEGLHDAKLSALIEALMNNFVLPVLQNETPCLGNLINGLNLLRYFALLQDPAGAGALPIMQRLFQVMV